MSFAKITLLGNLGKDVDLRYAPSGDAVASFSMATNEKRKDKSGEMRDVVTWFKITVWGKQAETAAKFLSKGSPVYIEGRLRTEEWTDRDGKTRTSLEVWTTDMQFISGGSQDESKGKARAAGAGSSAEDAAFGREVEASRQSATKDDDIPF